MRSEAGYDVAQNVFERLLGELARGKRNYDKRQALAEKPVTVFGDRPFAFQFGRTAPAFGSASGQYPVVGGEFDNSGTAIGQAKPVTPS